MSFARTRRTVKPRRPVKGWHMVNKKKCSIFGELGPVRTGETYTVALEGKPVELCERGLHGSATIAQLLDATRVLNGYEDGYLCRVSVWGDYQRGQNKFVAEFRRVEYMLDPTPVFAAFNKAVLERYAALMLPKHRTLFNDRCTKDFEGEHYRYRPLTVVDKRDNEIPYVNSCLSILQCLPTDFPMHAANNLLALAREPFELSHRDSGLFQPKKQPANLTSEALARELEALCIAAPRLGPDE